MAPDRCRADALLVPELKEPEVRDVELCAPELQALMLLVWMP